MTPTPTSTPNTTPQDAGHSSEVRIAAAVQAAYILDAVRR